MKKRVLVIAMCMILIVSLLSCDIMESDLETPPSAGTETTAGTIDDNDPYTFSSVSELKASIKKDVSMYENQQVTITGTILKSDNNILICETVSFSVNLALMDRYKAEMALKTNPNISIVMLDAKKVTLLETGDHVKIIGTVKISDVEIYLDNCDYEMIKSIYE